MYHPRTLEDALLSASGQFPVVLVTGPRQVGKTTLLQHLCEQDRRYVTLDDLVLRQLANDDPALFLQRFPAPLLIDEIQYAPDLLPYIKMAVDSSSQAGAFWLTGSQQFHLMKGVSESLAGRVAVIQLLGVGFDTSIQTAVTESSPEMAVASSETKTFLGMSHELIVPEKKDAYITSLTDEAAKASATEAYATADKQAGRDILKYAARFPAILIIAFGLIALYFRSRGGYKPVELETSDQLKA